MLYSQGTRHRRGRPLKMKWLGTAVDLPMFIGKMAAKWVYMYVSKEGHKNFCLCWYAACILNGIYITLQEQSGFSLCVSVCVHSWLHPEQSVTVCENSLRLYARPGHEWSEFDSDSRVAVWNRHGADQGRIWTGV